MSFRDLPLRLKLIVIGIAASAAALALTSAVFLVTTYFMVQRSVRNDLVAQAAIVADNSTAALAFGDQAGATETLEALRSKANVDVACLYDMGGLPFSQFANVSDAHCPANPLPDGVQTLANAVLVTQPVVVAGRRVGTVYVRGNLDELVFRMRVQALAAAGGFVFGLLAAVVIASRLEGVISLPLRSLSETAARISQGNDYTLRAPKHAPDEIGSLVDAFNGMVEQVERRDGRLSATNEELSRASRLKDEFLAALSHELRTPLNAILGWLQIIRTVPGGPEQTARALESLDRNARAQARLIEDLLDISRIISGKFHFKAEVVELVVVVQSAVDAIRPAAVAKRIDIVMRLPAPPKLVTGDADRLRQAIWNLLSNAVKFSPPGSRVDVDLAETSGQLVLTVRDNGPGIDAAFLPHVFDRFRQADGSLTRQHGGLGLGLAIASEIVALHGGTVGVSSDGPGRGAAFTISLPVLIAAQPEAQGGEEPPSSGRISLRDMTVLVVDDDADARELARRALAQAGAEVSVAEGSADALAAFGLSRFDALICDIAMPGEDGFVLLQSIRDREARNGRFTPAMAVTAHAGDESRRLASAAGYQFFLAKPYEFADLVGAVAQMRGAST